MYTTHYHAQQHPQSQDAFILNSPVDQHCFNVPSSPTTSVCSKPQITPATNRSTIGQPKYFLTGPHTGKIIRMELVEIQKADLGRKYAKVDRRPLDPPPVVHVRMYEVQESATPYGEKIEVEIDYEETQLLGLLCTVDLFPSPCQDIPYPQAQGSVYMETALAQPDLLPLPFFSSPGEYKRDTFQYLYNDFEDPVSPILPLGYGYLSHAEAAPTTIPSVDGHGFSLTEDSKQTQELVGATFVQPSIINYQGKKAIVFVFSASAHFDFMSMVPRFDFARQDLAVKIEGTFLLRYRAFDICSTEWGGEEPGIAAEAYGGTFRVYSTREFPGLAASTALTKHLSRWGVKVNIRDTARRQRKRGASNEISRGNTPGCNE